VKAAGAAVVLDEAQESVAAGYPPPLQGWWTVAVLTALSTVSLMDRSIFTLLIVPISKSLQINDFQVALLSGFSFALFYAVFGILFGWAVDRFERRRIILGGAVFWSFATIASGLSKNFAQLAFARFGVGAGEATLNPAGYSIIADAIPRKRLSMAIGVFGIGVMIGGFLAHMGGAALLQVLPKAGLVLPVIGLTEPWRVVFLALGAPGLLLSFLILTIREPLRRQRLAAAAGAGYLDALRYMRARWRFYAPFFLGAGLVAATNYAFATWLVTAFVRTYGLTVSQAGFLIAPLQVGPQIVGLLAAGALADYFFARGRTDIHLWLLMIFSTCKALLVSVALTSGVSMTVAALLIAAGTLFSGVAAVAPTVLQIATPNQFRGQVTATYLIVFTIVGAGFGPLIAGAMSTFVFHDPAKIGWAIAGTFLLLQPLVVLSLLAALKATRAAAAEADAWGDT
jgi:MFS family permease